MTVSAAPALAGPFDGNDAATSFPFDFKIFADSDLRVVLRDALTAEYLLTLDVDYSVSMNPDQNADPGGTITYPLSGSPLATGERLTVTTDLELSQQTVFTNLGKFFPATVEDTFDRITMLLRQIQAESVRAIRVPVSLSDVLTDLPTPVAGAALVWNEDGTALVNGIPSESLIAISSFMANVIQAVDAAEARSDIGAAADADVVKTTGDQTIADIKTFSSSPVIPDGAAAQNPISKAQLDAAVAAIARGLVRQSVLSGPVDSSGLPTFGGSTGSTTVTASGTLVATAANGHGATGAVDRVGVISNPSWTGLSTNGTMYLYLDIDADGTCTPGSTTLAPSYTRGSTYSTTSGQWTFSTGEMTGKLGDGSAANQVWRVFVGEVTVSGGVVSAITWYALRGWYESGLLSITALTLSSVNHNLGVVPKSARVVLVNQATEYGYSVGDEVDLTAVANIGGGANHGVSTRVRRNAIGVITANGVSIVRADTGAVVNLTLGNWAFRAYVQRGW